MAIGTGAAILGGAGLGLVGSKMGANAVERGNNAAVGEQRRQFDYITRLMQPQISLGNDARARIAALLGLGGGGSSGPVQRGGTRGRGLLGQLAGNMDADRDGMRQGVRPGGVVSQLRRSGGGGAPATAAVDPLSLYQGSPSFGFIRDQAIDATQGSAAAQGGLFSGGAVQEIADRVANVAALDFNNEINRLLALASGGQAATANLAGAAQSSGANISGLLANSGQAQAAGILGGMNSIGGALNNYQQQQMLQQILGPFNTTPQTTPGRTTFG